MGRVVGESEGEGGVDSESEGVMGGEWERKRGRVMTMRALGLITHHYAGNAGETLGNGATVTEMKAKHYEIAILLGSVSETL